MEILIGRHTFTNKSTIGDLFIDGSFQCFTLEDCVREIPCIKVDEWKVPNETAIPKGRYEIIIDYSKRFDKEMFHILDVPGFVGIRIHCGNNAFDTEGCIIVALGYDKKFKNVVQESKLAYDKIYPIIKNALDIEDCVYITIRDKI